MYPRCETNDQLVSLHDCHGTHITCEEGVLTISFPDGIWLMPEHPDNKTHQVVRTKAAQVLFHLDPQRDMEIYLFKETQFGQTLREEWTIHHLMALVNSGERNIEFIIDYRSRSFAAYLYKCALAKGSQPGDLECEIAIPAEQAIYRWEAIDATHVM